VPKEGGTRPLGSQCNNKYACNARGAWAGCLSLLHPLNTVPPLHWRLAGAALSACRAIPSRLGYRKRLQQWSPCPQCILYSSLKPVFTEICEASGGWDGLSCSHQCQPRPLRAGK